MQYLVYFAVRRSIPHQWINHHDQYLYPNNAWEKDVDFQNDCVVYSLFEEHNKVKLREGENRWIPFTENEVGCKNRFDSRFMSEFVAQRRTVSAFSAAAENVMAAGLSLWKYYHETIKKKKDGDINASFYDIRGYFQGYKESKNKDKEYGDMNPTSEDETYNTLIKQLRTALSALAKQIEVKVYEYGFLK